jgi:elongation factor P hydroxylase
MAESVGIWTVPTTREAQPQRCAEQLEEVRQLLDFQLADSVPHFLKTGSAEVPAYGNQQQSALGRQSRPQGRVWALSMGLARRPD